MYSVIAALKRRPCSSADDTIASGGSLAFRRSSSARKDHERANSSSMIPTRSRQLYGSNWTFLRYQS